MSEKPDLGFVHRFVPAETPGHAPLLLLHGTGGDENDLLPLGAQLSPAAALLSPRGKVNEQGMPRFFKRRAEGVFDIEDLKARTEELADFIESARKAYGIGKPIALGFSNGANIAWSLLLNRPETLAGAILIRGMLPFDPPSLPKLDGLPVLMLNGSADPIVPPETSERLVETLRRAGADVRYELLPASHQLTQQDLVLAAEWLRGR
ncbi:MAG: alpha/beta hydrolase [Bradyrhizobiaceae bacterium]|nr:alpha/beta hydrolase [Bradyrhizobiaceae bacterium]